VVGLVGSLVGGLVGGEVGGDVGWVGPDDTTIVICVPCGSDWPAPGTCWVTSPWGAVALGCGTGTGT
jgi:hypothetical protein